MDSERHVYRHKWWVRGGYLFLGLLLSGLSVTLIAIVILNRGRPGGFDLRAFFALIVCPVVGYMFLALALQSKVTLEGDRLTVRYAIGADSTRTGNIVGYRVVHGRNGKYWALRLRNGGSIDILGTYAVDDYYRDFISGLKPLNPEEDDDKPS